MAKRYSSVLGVDVGSHTIKVVEIKLQGRQPVVSALGMVPTPPGTVDHIGVHDSESTAFALKQAISESGASVPDAIVSLSGQGSVLVRTLEVQNMSDSELKQHMEWEFTRNIPFAESTVETDFKAYPPTAPDAQNLDVVMAIATRSAVDNLVAMLKKAGKKAAAIDVEPLGLLRAMNMSQNGQMAGKRVCLVEVGHKTTSINIYQDEKLLMPRQVPIGGELFTRAIADNMGMSFEEAELAKHTQATLPESAALAAAPNMGATVQSYNPFADDAGSAPADAPAEAPVESAPVAAPNQFYAAMAQPLDEFVSEVRRSIDYFKSKGGDVDAVLLCGGGSKLGNMDKFLASALGMSVEMFDPMGGLEVSPRKGDPELASNHRADFAVAVGNGLHICF
ncbi:type IV pilus assembly protein PilM [Kamptonema cortianum]|nr:type IV pilus assembly protein PilM [Kamptonema cortianum]